mgnify:CR=1 FL=1
MAVYQTAVQYHFWHALGLLAVGVLLLHKPESGALVAAARLLAAGIVVFCGSLYAAGAHGRARAGRRRRRSAASRSPRGAWAAWRRVLAGSGGEARRALGYEARDARQVD